ncbi:MAG: alpha-L-fucosidase [Planctomycetota bacterium]
MMNTKKRLLSIMCLFLLTVLLISCVPEKSTVGPLASTKQTAQTTKIITRPASSRTYGLAEWENLKYGMFIHYGMSTFTGKEFDDGKAPSAIYAPTDLDVKQWVKVAKKAGMKYIVLTSKHVAGHCLWDSENYDYDVATSSDKTDVVDKFVKACRAEGIKPCLYYCILDSRSGSKGPVTEEYFKLIKQHLTELHTKHPDIYEQWIDIPAKFIESQRQEVYELVKSLNPDCLILMNQGLENGTKISSPQWPTDLLNGERTFPPGTCHNPVKKYKGKTYYIPMEVCETIGERWFWEEDDIPKKVHTLYEIYKKSVGRGANLLLNVPPDRTGQISDYNVKALIELKKLIDNPSLLPESQTLTYGKLIKASGTYRHEYYPAYATDEDPSTRWVAPIDTKQAWLEVDLGKEATFDKAVLMENWRLIGKWWMSNDAKNKNWNYINKFELQVKRGGNWETFHTGSKIGQKLEISFEPITARHVRLNILDSTRTPSVSEFQLFEAPKSNCEKKQKTFKNEPASRRTKRIAEWESLKYGICFHYGMSTFTGKEIDDGKSPSATYAPTNIDVRQWIKVVKDAGAKYAMLTSKHVAGHCLWDSENYDYDVATSSDNTDVIAEFMAACKDEGIKPCIYYCILDGHNEGGIYWQDLVTDDYFKLVKHHLTELHTKYPGIYQQLIDIPRKLSTKQRQEIYELIKKINPDCLITMSQGFKNGSEFPELHWPTDLLNGERTFPVSPRHNPVKKHNGKTYYLPMEVWQTISERWFWEPDDIAKTTLTLYNIYQDSVGRGANLLLNITPDKTGQIPQYYIEALMELKKVIDDPSLLPKPKSLTYKRPIKVLGIHNGRPEYRKSYAVDEDFATRWAAPGGKKQAWIEVDLGSERTFDKAFLRESWQRVSGWNVPPRKPPKNWNNVKKFQIQAKQNQEWKIVAQGDTIGEGIEIKFAPVTARYVRLNILDAEGGPTISEFQLFASECK